MLFVRVSAGRRLRRADAMRFPAADAIEQVAGTQRLGTNTNVPQDRAGDALLVAPVVDGETLGVAQAANVPPQDLHAMRMEGRHVGTRLAAFSQQFRHPLLHLGRGLVRERDRQNPLGHDAVPDEFRNAERHDAGLAGPRAGQDEQGTGEGRDSLLLGWIQGGTHGLRSYHESTCCERAPAIDGFPRRAIYLRLR